MMQFAVPVVLSAITAFGSVSGSATSMMAGRTDQVPRPLPSVAAPGRPARVLAAGPGSGLDSVIRRDFVCNDDTIGGSRQQGPVLSVGPAGTFAVVWYETRDGDSDVWYQRFDASGSPLGANERVNTDVTLGWQGDPAVAIGPDGGIVATWQDRRDIGNSDLFAQRFDGGGVRLGDNCRVSDSAAAGDQGVSGVHVSPSRMTLVVWDDRRNGLTGDIYAQLLGPDGLPVGGNFRINDDGIGFANQYEPVVAGDDSGRFVVAWMDGRGRNPYDWNVFAQRYGAAGQQLGGNIQVTTQDSVQWSPAIACARSGQFVVAWEDRRRGGQWDVYAARFDAQGNPLGGEFIVNDDAGASDQYGASVAVNHHGEFLIAWTDRRAGGEDVYGRLFGADGTPLGGSFRLDDGPTGNQAAPSVQAVADGGYMVAWADARSGDFDVYCRRYGRTGTPSGPGFRVNDDRASSQQRVSSIGVDARGFFYVGWEDERDAGTDIYGSAFDAAGVPLGPNVRLNDDAPGEAVQYYTAVAGGNERFLAAWTDFRVSSQNSDIYGQFLDRVGQPMGANFRLNANDASFQWYPYCAMDTANRAAVVWMDTRDGPFRIYLRRFDSNGTPVSDETAVSDTVLEGAYASVASAADGRFVVAWMERWGSDYEVLCQAFRADGSPIGRNIRVNDDGLGVYQGYPACAMANDGRFAVAWEDTRFGCYDVYLQWFDSTGGRLGPNERVSDAPVGFDSYSPSCVFDGAGRLALSFNDEREHPGNPQIYCQRYRSDRSRMSHNQRVNEPNLFLNDHHWTVGQSVAAGDGTLAFAWTGNRRHRGWDIVAKLTDWNLVAVADARESIPSWSRLTLVARGSRLALGVDAAVYDVLGRDASHRLLERSRSGSTFHSAGAGAFFVRGDSGPVRKIVVY